MKTIILIASLLASVSAFGPSLHSVTRTPTSLFAEGDTKNKQPEYGQSLALPDSYVRCGGCQSHFALTPEDLGERGKGR